MAPQLLMHHAPQPHACTTVAPTETPTGVSTGALLTAGAFYYLMCHLYCGLNGGAHTISTAEAGDGCWWLVILLLLRKETGGATGATSIIPGVLVLLVLLLLVLLLLLLLLCSRWSCSDWCCSTASTPPLKLCIYAPPYLHL